MTFLRSLPWLLAFFLFGALLYGHYRSGDYARRGGRFAAAVLVLFMLCALFAALWLLFGESLGTGGGGIGGPLPPH
jgi:hypothetical protein